MTTAKRLALITLLLVCVVLPAFTQGLFWIDTMTFMGKEVTQDNYYMPKMFKVATGDGEIVLFRIDKRMMYTIDTKEKQYSEMTFEKLDTLLQKMGNKMKAAGEELRESMKDLSEAERKQMEQMLGGGGRQVPVEVKNTGGKTTIAGYACTKYVLQQGETELATVWTTRAIKEFASTRKDFEEFWTRMMGMNPKFGALAEGMLKVEGFPMAIDYGNDMKSVVSKVEKEELPASEFEVPPGYEKVKSKLGEGFEE